MEFIQHLWLAILLSAGAAWFWSFLSWALLNLHGGDSSPLPDEERFSAAMREFNIPAGTYSFPHVKAAGNPSGRNNAEFTKKWKAGPLGIIHVWSSNISMPRNMILSYLVGVVVSFLMAYVGHEVLPHGASFARVMQIMGTIGVLSYAFANLPNLIWFQGRPRVMALGVFDGVIQGLATGAVFAAMWPKA